MPETYVRADIVSLLAAAAPKAIDEAVSVSL